MAVAAVTMESIVILDDDEEEEEQQQKSQPSSSASAPRVPARRPKLPQPAPPTHITQSPFATAKKEAHVLQAENERLFAEFVAHCSTHTQDCPEVLAFLHTKHAKVSPDFLSSVEFRNTLGRCLTRAQASTAKTFVYINELCTVLKQHGAKRRAPVLTLPPAAKRGKDERKTEGGKEEGSAAAQEAPSTSAQPEEGDEEEKRKTKKASKRQIAYLENLLKMYNEEIKRLQEKEMSVTDLQEEDSSYIQEHKLKRKMMKIYDKLCELKDCSTLTGRVIEQRIDYKGTRYPEINKKIERFINSAEAQLNPPDYTDILLVVQRANERHGLSLSRRQLAQISQDAFRETGNRLQERRHLDMVYNFGSHLTDLYKPTTDPALTDLTLARKLRSNREVALSSLEEVISKYAVKQDDTEDEERRKRQERDRQKKEQAQNPQQDAPKAEVEPKEDKSEGEEEDEEDEVSSDPDIEEEIQASQAQAQAGPDDDEEDDNEEEQVNDSDAEEQRKEELPSIKSSLQDEEEGEEEENGQREGAETGEEDQRSVSSDPRGVTVLTSPGAVTLKYPSPLNSPMATAPRGPKSPSSSDSPSQSEAAKSNPPPDDDLLKAKPVSPNHLAAMPLGTNDCTEISMANQDSLPPSPVLISTNQDSLPPLCATRSTNCSPMLTETTPNPRKRKRTAEVGTRTTHNVGTRTTHNGTRRGGSESESDITLDMYVSSSPLQADSTRADTPTQEMVTSSQSTPPPKKNKVNVATQCDPDEVIVLSDSD